MPKTVKKNNSWYRIRNLDADTAEVMIYDVIGYYGINAAQFRGDLNNIKAAKVDVRINSPGGDCADCAAICTAISEHPAEFTAHIDGMALSAASVIACACDNVEMSATGFMMIHNAVGGAYGYAKDLKNIAGLLDKLSNSIADVYAQKTGKSKADITAAMDAETWFDADEAKAFGLVDFIKKQDDDQDDDDDDDDDDAEMRAAFGRNLAAALKYNNVPAAVRRAAASLVNKNQSQQRDDAPAIIPPPIPKEATMAAKVINRDGKTFAVVDGKEIELEAASASGSENAGTARETPQQVQAKIDKAAADAVANERAYSSTFNTIVVAAGLTGKTEEKFRKDFYGLPVDQVKFIAENSMAGRAKPVGEGNGGSGGADEAEGRKAKILADASARFHKEPKLRGIWGVFTNNKDDAQYKKRLADFLDCEMKVEARYAKTDFFAHRNPAYTE